VQSEKAMQAAPKTQLLEMKGPIDGKRKSARVRMIIFLFKNQL
jgi:hypothetical protein